MTKKKSMPQRGRRIGKDAWIEAARDALVSGGLEAVKVERIAKTMNATRAAFYWHFESREHLLKELLDFWKRESTKAYDETAAAADHDGAAELEMMNNLWRDDKDFDPRFDAAMRDWARVDKKAARIVKQVDQKRIDALQEMFLDLGYDHREALVRARIAFMQQVGYYTMGIKESRKARRELAPIYLKVLRGR